MDTDQKRKITEDEFFFVEEAFLEFKDKGSTDKNCPWCSGNLIFEDHTSAHTIRCANCELTVTARGF